MIALLSCSTNLLANNTDVDNLNPSMGEVVQPKDSVLISYDDLRLVNSKLIELDYEKQINNNLHSIIANDSTIIENYKILNENVNKSCKKAIRQRNIAISGAALFLITTIVTLLIK